VTVFLFSRCIYCQLQMQIIHVSLAKVYENVMLQKFPDKQQNSPSIIPWHSSKNQIPWFSRKWEPWKWHHLVHFHLDTQVLISCINHNSPTIKCREWAQHKQVILETSLSRQSLALVLTTQNKWEKIHQKQKKTNKAALRKNTHTNTQKPKIKI